MKIVTIHRDVSHTQSKGCWLCIHMGYTAVFFHRPRLPGRLDRWQGLRVEINSGLSGKYRLCCIDRGHPNQPTPHRVGFLCPRTILPTPGKW